MTNEEFDELCEALRAQGFSTEDLLNVILQMFKDKKIDLEDMKKLAGALGYELTDEFISKVGAPEANKAEDAVEDISEEEVEDAQEVEPGEDEEDEPEEDEKDEKKKARDLFNLD